MFTCLLACVCVCWVRMKMKVLVLIVRMIEKRKYSAEVKDIRIFCVLFFQQYFSSRLVYLCIPLLDVLFREVSK